MTVPRLVAAFAVVMVAVMLPAACAHAADSCAACGKAIEGRYMKVSGELYHAACFTCALCGEPISGGYVTRDEGGARRRYHESCFQDHLALRCSNCGGLIQGEYFPAGGKSYCPACYESEIAPRCAVCGRAIMDQNYFVNPWNEAAHSSCAEVMRSCDGCGRAVGGARGSRVKELPDGRGICETCATTGITDPRAARAILDAVSEEIAAYGIVVDPARVGLELSGRDVLERFTGRPETMGHTAVASTFRDRELVSETLTIHILDHLGRDRFASVAAHELTHVFLHRPGAPGLPRRVEEGFCNYIASLVLRDRQGELARHALRAMEEDPDPDYGGGYRSVRAWVAANRLETLTAALREGRVPEGL